MTHSEGPLAPAASGARSSLIRDAPFLPPPAAERPASHLGDAPVGAGSGKPRLIVVVPVFNDWAALAELLRRLDEVELASNPILEVLVVDDSSTLPLAKDLQARPYARIRAVHVLRLRRNLGHQRAIAVGLSFLSENASCDYVVVMDGDGEDDPHDIGRLLAAATGESPTVVLARRTRRREGILFKLFYLFYRQLHRLLVGQTMAVGNFSVVPSALLPSVVVVSEIWNHYSSGLRHARIPCREVRVPRSKRLAGRSQMHLVSLITHGLSSIAVYSETVATRVIVGMTGGLAAMAALLLTVAGVRLFTTLAVPGWATYTSGLLILLMSQLVLIGMVFSMAVLSGRQNTNVLPVRDYHQFIANLRRRDA